MLSSTLNISALLVSNLMCHNPLGENLLGDPARRDERGRLRWLETTKDPRHLGAIQWMVTSDKVLRSELAHLWHLAGATIIGAWAASPVTTAARRVDRRGRLAGRAKRG